MTVSTQTNSVTYQANGVTTVFAYPFRILQAGDLSVYFVDADGVQTEQVSGFTVSGVNSSNGGNVTFSVAPTSGTTVFLERDMSLVQPTDFKNQSPFYALTHETSFDRLTMLLQQVFGVSGSVLKGPLFEGAIATIPGALARANMYLGFDADGQPIVLPDTDGFLRSELATPGNGDGADLVSFNSARTVLSKLRDTVNLADYADLAVGNNWDAALLAALIAGKTVIIDELPGGVFYEFNNAYGLPSYTSIIAGKGRPRLKCTNPANSRLFLFSGSTIDAHVRGMYIDGNKAVTPTDVLIVFNGNASYCSFTDNQVVNAPGTAVGCVVVTSPTALHNRITNNYMLDSEGTAIGLSNGMMTEVCGNLLQNNGGFGIRLGEGASHNKVCDNRSTSSTLELVGVTWNCQHNQVSGNYAEGSGDNGISISGKYNVVTSNRCYRNQKAGIGIWGSYNTVTGNECVNNNLLNTNFWSGVWLQAGFGGTGQFNTITGNNCDDNQAVPTQYGNVRLHGNGYVAWATGVPVSAGDYRQNGANIYVAANTGTTGVTAPVHTTGTVSDGTVSWTYINSFILTNTIGYNHVAGNTRGRAQAGATLFFDALAWATSTLMQGGALNAGDGIRGVPRVEVGGAIGWTSIGQMSIKDTGNAGLAIESGATSLGRVAFGDGALAGAVEYDHNTDELSLFAGGSKRFRMVGNNFAFGGLGPFTRPTYGAPTGTPDRTTFDIPTATTAQIAARLAAVIQDLRSRGDFV